MAGNGVLRCTTGLNRLLQRAIIQNAVPKHHIATTSEAKARVYGPTEQGMPAITSHWKTERVVSIALLPLIPAALVLPTAALDMGLSAVMVLHTHWGLQGVMTDYIHGKFLKSILSSIILTASILAFAGLCYLNMNDIGFAKAVRKIYSEL